jgi:arginase family enzyme
MNPWICCKPIFETKQVVGCDVVELSYRPHDRNSPFAVAKLIYKMIGFKFAPSGLRTRANPELLFPESHFE